MPVNGSIVAACLWPSSARSFAIARRMNAVEIVASSDSTLITVSHALENSLSFAEAASGPIRGLRSRKTAPLTNRMKIAGQRDRSCSPRLRQNSNAVNHRNVTMIAALSAARIGDPGANAANSQASSQTVAPVISEPGRGSRRRRRGRPSRSPRTN